MPLTNEPTELEEFDSEEERQIYLSYQEALLPVCFWWLIATRFFAQQPKYLLT